MLHTVRQFLIETLGGTLPALPAVQRDTSRGSLRTPPATPSTLAYQQFATGFSTLTYAQKYEVMQWLTDTNWVAKTISRIVIYPIIGNTGFGVTYHPDTPAIEETVNTFFSLNQLNKRSVQREMVRTYVMFGELCYLAAPYMDSWYLVRCPSRLIRQTVLDPLNPSQIIGILLEPGYFGGQAFFYKTICDERRLSWAALKLREQARDYCFYYGNFENDAIETVTGLTFNNEIVKGLPSEAAEWSNMQRRGEPFLVAWADLFQMMMDVMWALLDKSKSYGLFNTVFRVKTEEPDFDRSVARVKQWKDLIGTPEMNSAIYVDDSVTIEPMNFSMNSGDVKQMMDVLLQLTGLSGNVSNFELGANLGTTYATTRAQGAPQEQYQIAIQTDMEDMLLDMARFVARDAVATGKIPMNEVEQSHVDEE